MKIGILALQGAVAAHAAALADLDVGVREIRAPVELSDVDALILPGGESTTVSRLIDLAGLRAPIAERLAGGMPAMGTCAGMILLAREVLDGRPDQRSFGAIDITVRRNAFGRQIDSCEVDLPVEGAGGGALYPAVFIRAPYVERVGPGVEVLASFRGHPVACRQGPVLVTAFHPELSGDRRIHEAFVRTITGERV